MSFDCRRSKKQHINTTPKKAHTINRLTAIEKKIYQTKSEAPQDILNFPPRLDSQLLGLLEVVESAEARPTDGARQRFDDLRKELDSYLAELDQIIDTDLAEFVTLVKSEGVEPVIVP